MLEVTKKNKSCILLKPVVNKSNGQVNFSLKKNSLPLNIKKKLHNLKSIKLNAGNLQFK